MTDQYGIPANMFGPVPEEFFGAIGRVTMVASILDMRLLELLWVLENEPQHVNAGRATADVTKRIQKGLTRLTDSTVSADLSALLIEASGLLSERHALVHSVWAEPGLDGARGWRYRHLSQRKGAEESVVKAVIWTDASRQSLRDLVGSMVDLCERLARYTQHLHSARARRLAAGSGQIDAS